MMAKERLSKLQKYILNNCENKSITWDDVLSKFYNIEEIKFKILELKYELKSSKEIPDKKEKRRGYKKLRAKLERIKNSVALAFNQLYLKKLVKRKYDDRWVDIDEQMRDYIAYCDKKIKIYRDAVRKGEGGILCKCTLVNYLDKKESLLNTEIMSTKRWNVITREHKKGELIICGSDICYHVNPDEIRKKREENQ